MQKAMEIQTRNLVVGSGIAGLYLAIQLAHSGEDVLVITKGALEESNSQLAQGGIASVFDHEDSFDVHIQDTIRAGAGLCHEDIVRTIVEAGPHVIEELVKWGVSFTKQKGMEEDLFHLTQEGGHSRRRVVHSQDATGRAIMEALIHKVLHTSQIKVLSQHMAIDLLTTDKYAPDFSANSCLGAYVLDIKSGHILTIKSEKTFLCTGGHGRVYLYTSNPPLATGDGLALGWRAGCRVANLEFMQFHPTCFFHPSARGFLISEALRGEGAVIRNSRGVEFLKEQDPAGSLAPRDIVARAIDLELKKTGKEHVYLDATHLGEKAKELFPTIYQNCLNYGVDITKDYIPVVPAAHYSCGGLVTDELGRTNIHHLYAVGETACTGLHGANRLASNSLLEACVMATRAAKASQEVRNTKLNTVIITPWNKGKALSPDEGVVLTHLWDEIRRLMWHYVGIVRTEKRLQRALSRISSIRQELDEYYWSYEVNANLLEVRNLSQVAWLTIRCALSRKESRGIHFTLDYPKTSEFGRDSILW
jgi:L-aspartate oxidase